MPTIANAAITTASRSPACLTRPRPSPQRAIRNCRGAIEGDVNLKIHQPKRDTVPERKRGSCEWHIWALAEPCRCGDLTTS